MVKMIMMIAETLRNSILRPSSLNTPGYSPARRGSSFKRSIIPLSNPRSTRIVLNFRHRALNVGVSISTHGAILLQKNVRRRMLFSREVLLESGQLCHPEGGRLSSQMLVRRRHRRVMSKFFESGRDPSDGNSISQ